MADGIEIVLADPKVKSELVNVFKGITACDTVANGIVQAIEMLKARGELIDKPVASVLICRCWLGDARPMGRVCR